MASNNACLFGGERETEKGRTRGKLTLKKTVLVMLSILAAQNKGLKLPFVFVMGRV